MKNFLKLVQDGPVTQCLVKGEPVASKFQGSMDYPVSVNGEEYTFTASSIAHAMIQKLGIKFGQIFRIQKVSTEKGSKFRIWNATGTEAVLEKGERPASSYNGGQRQPTTNTSAQKYTPEELGSIISQWAINTAVLALATYQAAGNQVSDNPDQLILTMARKYYYLKCELEPEIIDDIRNKRKEEANS